MIGACLVLSFAFLAQPGGSTPPASPAGLTRELSDAFGRKLQMLEKFEHDPKLKRSPVNVFESELNSYVRFALAEKVPRGLREVRIVLREGRIELRGLANLSDFAELKDKAAGTGSFLSLLAGEMPVEIEADFTSDRGFGQFEVRRAQVGPIPLSAALLSDLVARATIDAAHPTGFDIRAPFRLPYSAKRIKPRPALATIEY